MDESAAVREEWVRVAGDWCLNLWERVDHETRLIPYILTGISDEAPAVQKVALQYMDAIGAQYEREKERDLNDTLVYNPEDLALPPGEYADGPLAYLPAPFTGALEFPRNSPSRHSVTSPNDEYTWMSQRRSYTELQYGC
jgi:hypothetical protein